MTLWHKSDTGWSYELFELETSLPEDGPFQDILTKWNQNRTNLTIPDWKNFDLDDFKDFYGWLTLLVITHNEPFDFIYRLWGTIFGQSRQHVFLKVLVLPLSDNGVSVDKILNVNHVTVRK